MFRVQTANPAPPKEVRLVRASVNPSASWNTSPVYRTRFFGQKVGLCGALKCLVPSGASVVRAWWPFFSISHSAL